MTMAPPTEPGIQDKNSKPLKEFSLANLAKFLSKVAAPTSIIFGSDILILANLGLNLITIPLQPLSLIKVLEPAPRRVILLSIFLYTSL